MMLVRLRIGGRDRVAGNWRRMSYWLFTADNNNHFLSGPFYYFSPSKRFLTQGVGIGNKGIMIW